jgi:transcriptional regulator with XRE-family HTH domain
MAEDVRRMVGRNVQRLRTEAGLSQAALAERMGVDRAYVSGLELGQRNPTIVTLWHIAKALGASSGNFSRRREELGAPTVRSPRLALVSLSQRESPRTGLAGKVTGWSTANKAVHACGRPFPCHLLGGA